MRLRQRHTQPKDHEYARKLRRAASSVEQRLWTALLQATGKTEIRFRRQQPIHPYIVDFACMRARLVIEIDGMSHDTQVEYDRKRETYLREAGFTVLRFNNDEVIKNTASVVEGIVKTAEEGMNGWKEIPSPAKTKA